MAKSLIEETAALLTGANSASTNTCTLVCVHHLEILKWIIHGLKCTCCKTTPCAAYSQCWLILSLVSTIPVCSYLILGSRNKSDSYTLKRWSFGLLWAWGHVRVGLSENALFLQWDVKAVIAPLESHWHSAHPACTVLPVSPETATVHNIVHITFCTIKSIIIF